MSRTMKFRITPEVLGAALQLPSDATIIRIWDSTDLSNTFWMVAQSDEFEDVPEGSAIPECTPSVNLTLVEFPEDLDLIEDLPIRVHTWTWDKLP